MLRIVAHGVGSRGGLPLELWQFAWAAIAALVISFLALSVLWREPRLGAAAKGHPAAWTSALLRFVEPAGRFVALALYALVLIAALFGSDNPAVNVAPTAIYVVVWIVLPVVVAFSGDFLAHTNPFHTIALGLGRLGAPTSGCAPLWSTWLAPVAAVGFFSLASGDSPRVLSLATLAYSVVVVGGSDLWRDLVGTPSGWSGAGVAMFGLIDAIVILSALYLFGVAAMARSTDRELRDLARLFAPSLIPIALGYVVAHYFQLALDETQTFVFELSDPLGRGWDLFGGADARINSDVVDSLAVAWVQSLAIVVGHVAAVFVAHDRAVVLFDGDEGQRSQRVMLLVMVLYSVLGLWLLLEA